MAQWTRQQQEQDGLYFFSGRPVITRGAQALLSPAEITLIIADLKEAVSANNGLDYLQVYSSDSGDTIWIIDQLSKPDKDSGDYTAAQIEEYDVWTILLPSEY